VVSEADGVCVDWRDFERAAPEIAAAGRRLLADNEVAFLATVSASGRPRIHPFVPRIVDGRFVAFIMNTSPKIRDLRSRRQCSVHALSGPEDEEFYLSGEAEALEAASGFRDRVADAMGFHTGVDESHVLFEFRFDRALHTEWLDFGTPDHRPRYWRWQLQPPVAR